MASHPRERKNSRPLSRREFLRNSAIAGAALSVGGSALLAACGKPESHADQPALKVPMPEAPNAPAASGGMSVLSTIQNQEDAPPCSTCGSIMIRSGACYKCANCGNTSGCA